MNLPRWFRQAWPYSDARKALLAEYGQLKRLNLVLADIGMRGGLWGDPGRVASLYEAGVAAGRRQMALEIFRIVRADPTQLFGYVPTKRETDDQARSQR